MKLKQACTIYSDYGLNISAEAYTDEGIPIIRTSDVADSGALDLTNAKYVDRIVVGKKKLRRGDVLFSRSGTIGRAMVFESDVDATYAAYLVRFRPHPRRLISDYIKYWAQSDDYWHQISVDTIQSTIGNFNANKFANLSIPLPDLPTQRQIADFLDRETARIDLLIEKKQRLVELLRERYMTKLFNEVSGSVSRQASYPNCSPLAWPRRSVRSIVKSHKQGFYTTEDYSDSGFRLVRITDITPDGHVRVKSAPFVADSKSARDFLLEPGDIVFARTGGAGACGLFEAGSEAAVFASYLIRFRFSPGCDARFMRCFFLSACFTDAVRKDLHGGVLQNLSAENIKQQKIALPPMDYQRQVVNRLDKEAKSIDRVVKATESSVARLREFRSALITACVTGQIEVATYAKSGATDRRLDAIQKEMEA